MVSLLVQVIDDPAIIVFVFGENCEPSIVILLAGAGEGGGVVGGGVGCGAVVGGGVVGAGAGGGVIDCLFTVNEPEAEPLPWVMVRVVV